MGIVKEEKVNEYNKESSLSHTLGGFSYTDLLTP